MVLQARDRSSQMVVYKGPQSRDGKSVGVAPVNSHWPWGPVGRVSPPASSSSSISSSLQQQGVLVLLIQKQQLTPTTPVGSSMTDWGEILTLSGWGTKSLWLVGLAGGGMKGRVPVLSQWGLVWSCLRTFLCP